MADEAFALSPISARATQPGEADYEAISTAFMETSRGRWFLSEYAKRNRNADTRMVLDAVARIEENLAAQKNVADDRLAEALQVIGTAVNEARAAAARAGHQAETALAPIQGAARILRETLMRLREIGADGRIYELMESQVNAIETGCREFQSRDAGHALASAFDLLDQRIAEFGGSANAAPVGETRPFASSEILPAATAPAPSGESVMQPAGPELLAAAEAAQDDAVLDMIALEMAAPDFAGQDADAICAAEPEPIEPAIAAAIEPPQEPEHEASLGASLLARGIVRSAEASAADPLAPIRRMSQADKIALFS